LQEAGAFPGGPNAADARRQTGGVEIKVLAAMLEQRRLRRENLEAEPLPGDVADTAAVLKKAIRRPGELRGYVYYGREGNGGGTFLALPRLPGPKIGDLK